MRFEGGDIIGIGTGFALEKRVWVFAVETTFMAGTVADLRLDSILHVGDLGPLTGNGVLVTDEGVLLSFVIVIDLITLLVNIGSALY